MKDISLNGHKLHEVGMLLPTYHPKAVSYLKYPESHFRLSYENDQIILSIPVALALELYRSSILPQDEGECFPVQVHGQDLGLFRVTDLRYNKDDTGLVTLWLKHDQS